MKISRLNVFLSTLNLVLCFVGYPFVTTLLLPAQSDVINISRLVTIPYRAFALIVCLLVIMINFKRPVGSLPMALKMVLFYWVILIVRIVYDRNFGVFDNTFPFIELWLFIFGICIPALISIIKSYKYIDFENAFYCIIGLATITLMTSIFSNQSLFEAEGLEMRQDGNVAFNTISFGHLGVTTTLLGIYALIKKKLNYIYKIVFILIISLGIYCMLRAGSRGPVVTLFVVLFIWQFYRSINFLNSCLLITFCFVFIFLFEHMVEIIGIVAPVMESRIKSTIAEKKDLDARESEYTEAIEAFFDSPIIGNKFALLNPDGGYGYAHNIILDSLMGLGFIGTGVFLYFIGIALIKSCFIIKNNDTHYWLGLMLIQQILASMVSGSFYQNQLLSVLLAIQFLFFQKNKRI